MRQAAFMLWLCCFRYRAMGASGWLLVSTSRGGNLNM